MSERFQKIVNTPHEFVGKFGKKIKDTTPKKISGKFARGAGIGLSALTQFLLWVPVHATVDNLVTRFGEEKLSKIKVGRNKEGKPKKLSSFIKHNPNFSSICMWLLFWPTLYGGIKTAKDLKSEDSVIKENIEYAWRFITHRDGEIEDLLIDPKASDEEWEQQVNAVHPYVVAHIFSTEGFIEGSYDDNGGSGTKTVGAGFTLDDDTHVKFAERVLQRPMSAGKVYVTKSEARLLAETWLKEKVYPEIKSQFTKPLDYKLFTILAVAGYNRGNRTYRDGNTGAPVRREVNKQGSKESILYEYVHAFGGVRSTKWGGLPNKYAVCALYYDGKVSDETILEAISEAPYTLEDSVKVYQRKHPRSGQVLGRLVTYDKNDRVDSVITPENINEMLLATTDRTTKGTVQEPVKNYLTKVEVKTIKRGRLFPGKKRGTSIVHLKTDDVKEKEEVSKDNKDFDKAYDKALDFYKRKKYNKAADKYEKLISKYPKQALLYNDLAATYNKLERYDDAIALAQKVIYDLHDRSQYGAAQYNAGFAYEQKGDLQRALENYNLAVANGNRVVKNDVARVKNKIQEQKNSISKATVFNDGAIRVIEKADRKTLEMQIVSRRTSRNG